MEILVDTANKEHIEKLKSMPFVDGITTNPSIIAKENEEFKTIIQNISSEIHGMVWAQVVATEVDEMINEGMEISSWGEDMVVKLPMTENGIIAASYLKEQGVRVNMTLIYTPAQVVLAAKVGVDYISPYIGRMLDQGIPAYEFITTAQSIIKGLNSQTKIIGASIRSPQMVVDLISHEIDAVTMSYSVFKSMFKSNETQSGNQMFLADWKKYLNETSTNSNFIEN